MQITDIFTKRSAGNIRVGYYRSRFHEAPSISYLLPIFGFYRDDNDTTGIDETDRQTAISVLTALFHKDMAYDGILMEQVEAESLAAYFLQTFPQDGARYFINGRWDMWILPGFSGRSWGRLTDSTFDGGVIVITDSLAGFIWFEDED